MLNLESKMKLDNYKIDEKKIAREIEESYLPISALIGKVKKKKQSGGGKFKTNVIHRINDDTLRKIGYNGINEDLIGQNTQISSKIVNKMAGMVGGVKDMKDMKGGKFGFGDLFGNEIPAGGSELLFKSLMGSPIQNNYSRSLPYNNESIMPDGNYHQPDYSPSKYGGSKKIKKSK